jgi:hypothetical protein
MDESGLDWPTVSLTLIALVAARGLFGDVGAAVTSGSLAKFGELSQWETRRSGVNGARFLAPCELAYRYI